jgi:hypothetical protein
MVSVSPENRPSFHEIMVGNYLNAKTKAVLEPYSENIRTGQPFEVNFDVVSSNMAYANQLSGGSLKIKVPVLQ